MRLKFEIHLRPSLQRKILLVVLSLLKNSQIFILTHSPLVISSIFDAWIYKFTLENGKSHLSGIVTSKTGFNSTSVLDDVFDVDEDFDVETEKSFNQFYFIRSKMRFFLEIIWII